jgi:hypothetical protein
MMTASKKSRIYYALSRKSVDDVKADGLASRSRIGFP